MEERRDEVLGPMEPLRPAVTDHEFVEPSGRDDPLSFGRCQHPDSGAGDICGRSRVEHARSWGR
jgi:hypothetical protein